MRGAKRRNLAHGGGPQLRHIKGEAWYTFPEKRSGIIDQIWREQRRSNGTGVGGHAEKRPCANGLKFSTGRRGCGACVLRVGSRRGLAFCGEPSVFGGTGAILQQLGPLLFEAWRFRQVPTQQLGCMVAA